MPTELTSHAPTALDAERAVKALLHEWLAQWFDGTTKALGAEAACAWPSVPGARIVFDVGPRPDGEAPHLRLLLLEQKNERGARPGLAGQTGGDLRFATYLCHLWVSSSETAAPGQAEESVATIANLVRALAENRDAVGQLGVRSVRVLSVRNVGAVAEEGAGATHLVSLTVQATYRVHFTESAA
jgi:hypothetical protein